MASPEFSKIVNQVGGVTAGAQKQLSDLMEKYLVSMNPAEPGADGQHGRAAAIDRGTVETRSRRCCIRSIIIPARRRTAMPGRRGRRAPSGRPSPGGRAKVNASAGPGLAGSGLAGSSLAGSIWRRFRIGFSPRCNARSSAASRRRIYFVVRPVAGIDAERYPERCRGTMNLYHYRPVADEIYRVPILIVMATTNRGYILDMVPGQSFIEFSAQARLRRLHARLDRAQAGREKVCGMEDYVLDFIPDCVRRVQRDSGRNGCYGDRLLLRRRLLSLLYGSILRQWGR